MVGVRLVAASREPVSEGGSVGILKRYPVQAEILSDEEVFHRRESCPLENFNVCQFVLPSDLHD